MKKGIPPAQHVDEYLLRFPADVSAVLTKLRQVIKSAAPEAEELISYQIPTYKYCGPLVHFAAFSDHCSLYTVNKNIVKQFAAELKPFKISGTTIHFSPGKPIPAALVKKIVKERIAQNEELQALKKPAKTSVKLISSGKSFTAKQFVDELKKYQSDEELKKIARYFKSGEGEYSEGDRFIGVRMGTIFKLAKTYMNMPPAEIEKLLESPVHEVRVGAVSIMDFLARDKKTTAEQKKELFDLYLRRHDRINNWDLVDRSAIYVIGSYLFDKPRKVLYKLAKSKNMWERRTAIVSTAYFIKHGQTEDTFAIAELLLKDKEDLIHKAAGGWIREAGKNKHRHQLLAFLDKHAATMPRTFLRYAIEHLDRKQKDHYMSLGK